MSFSSEEIANIHVVINSGDIPDFSEKMRDAAKSVSQLQEEIQQTQKDLGILAARGDQNTDNFKVMQNHLSKLQTQLKNTNKEMKYYTESIDINLMSSNQLNARSKVLANTLNALSKEAEPDRWNELNDELIKVRRRMDEVRVGTLGVSDSMDITGMSMQQLDVYSRQLKARLAAIPRDAANSKEWNTLKKRLDEVTSEQKKLNASLSDRIMGFLKGGAVSGFVTAGLAVVKKFGQDIIANSNAIGDRWNRTMTGMRKGYETFLTALASGDWSNFFSNIARAYREGRELAEMQEALFEMQNASSLTETRNNIEISRQTAIMRDTTRSNEERIAAANEILRLEREIMETKERTAERAREAALEEIRIKTKGNLSEEDMVYMVDNYFQNEEMINAAGDYLKLEEELKDLQKLTRRAAYRDSPGFAAGVDRKIEELEKEMRAMLTSTDDLERVVEFQREYDLLNDEQIQNYVNAQTSWLKAQADFEQATLRAKTTMSRLKEELKDENYQKAVDEVERQAKEETNIYKQQYVERKISEEEMNRELERIEMERLQRVNEINRQFGVDIVESTGAVLDNMISSMDGFTQAAADGSEEALDRVIQKSKELNAELEKMLADSEAAVERMMEAEQAGMQASLDKDGNRLASDVQQAGEIKNRFADTNTRLTLLSADKDDEMAQLQSLYDQKLIAEEEFQAARNEVIRRYASEAFNIQTQSLQNGLQVASGFLNNISSLVSSIQEAESATLDAQMQKELAAAGDNADKREAIEEKYQAKKLEIQKKYADIDMGIQIAQAIAAGALAIIQTWTAAKGDPVLAGIYTGLVAATTAAQVATIVMQRNAIKNSTVSSSSSGTTSVRTVIPEDSGYSEGGFTGYGGRLEPAGIVHRGEYVVPVPEMRDPEAYSHVMAIERIRARRSTRNRLPGFADGGYTGDPSSSSAAAAIKEMTEVFKSLRDNPIKAYTVLSEHNAAQEISNKFKKAASRK
jgi:hypothetical protein